MKSVTKNGREVSRELVAIHETVTNQRKAFTNTSNNFSLSGFDSRHGFKELTKQNNTEAMSLDEGHDFVTKMAKTYIKKAHLSAPYA
ncbi:hypothetical protein [Alcanivorax sp.]|uniref:hypothetical protein n=1 Tax=Alcanivorax sp. TaxID=1872427 RepID=UPI0025BBEABF|nr:hypothetical protein [Alcanivorax sp.]